MDWEQQRTLDSAWAQAAGAAVVLPILIGIVVWELLVGW